MAENSLLISGRRTVVWGWLYYLAFIPLLAVVPYWFSIDENVASAAAAEGYNNHVAYLATMMWSVVGMMAFGMGGRYAYLGGHRDVSPGKGNIPPVSFKPTKSYFLEVVILVGGVLIIYFPVFLSKYGPYIEDHVFLTALHRMQSGQQPYTNFEFLYGPLMIYPAYLWTKSFGYSMNAYYAYLALLEALQFVILLTILHHYFPQWRTRLATFVLAGVFLFNTLLAPNQNGLRKLLPVLAILLITNRPLSRRMVIAGSVLIGMQLAYSHEYGVAALMAIVGMYGFLAFMERKHKYILFAVAVAGVSGLSWFVAAALLLGGGISSYVKETLYLVDRFGSGEAGFPFYWTINSLAIFGLLALTCVIIGLGVGKARGEVSGPGDRLLLCGVVYALVGLKSGLNRCDLWHLDPAILVLLFAFLLPCSRFIFVYSERVRRVAVCLIVTIAATYFVGLLPTGSFYARGWASGLQDVMASESRAPMEKIKARAPTIELERRHPRLKIMRLAQYLAESSRSDRPVLFYGDLWSLGTQVGVYKTDFVNDDFLHSDERGLGLRRFLQEREGALVIIRERVYERLYGLSDPGQFPEYEIWYRPTITKRIASWVSTVHFEGVQKELPVKERRWIRTVGNYIVSQFEVVAAFDDLIVLSRRKIS